MAVTNLSLGNNSKPTCFLKNVKSFSMDSVAEVKIIPCLSL